MNNLSKKLETVANIGIIIVVLLFGGVLVKRFVLTDPTIQASAKDNKSYLTAGNKMPLDGIDWAANQHTLILVLSKNCRYCTQSLPFYQKLSEEFAAKNNLQFTAVFPEETSIAHEYLSQNKILVESTIQASPPKLGIRGTPTILLINSNGEVVESWLGKLTESEEKQVFERVQKAVDGN